MRLQKLDLIWTLEDDEDEEEEVSQKP